MSTVVVEDPTLAHGRLYELGLSEAVLVDALRAGLSAAAACTENHPANFAGMAMWAETVCYLRDTLLREGWTRSEVKGFATVVSGDGSIAVAVARGDDVTGSTDEGAVPSTKHPKGTVTFEIVGRNQYLLPYEDLLAAISSDGGAPATWLLLHSRDGDRVKCELSLPTAINGSGFVEAWDERIILGSIDLDPTRLPVAGEDPVNPIVDVTRRQVNG